MFSDVGIHRLVKYFFLFGVARFILCQARLPPDAFVVRPAKAGTVPFHCPASFRYMPCT